MIWIKVSKNPEKFLLVRGEAENQHWMAVTFDPSDSSALILTFCIKDIITGAQKTVVGLSLHLMKWNAEMDWQKVENWFGNQVHRILRDKFTASQLFWTWGCSRGKDKTQRRLYTTVFTGWIPVVISKLIYSIMDSYLSLCAATKPSQTVCFIL